MTTWVALLRGVNITRHRPVDMAALRSCCEALGFTRVETYLRSGNVVFDAGRIGKAKLSDMLADAVEAEFGFRAPVALRSSAELRAIAAASPFAGIAANEPTRVAVMFLDRPPDAEAVARLKAMHRGPEQFRIDGADMHVHYPDGVGKSKLTSDLIDRTLGVTATGRNWNTVTALLAMAEAHAAPSVAGKPR